jgi:hypothetical protein
VLRRPVESTGVKQPPLWLDRAAVIDPSRHFASAHCRIAIGRANQQTKTAKVEAA